MEYVVRFKQAARERFERLPRKVQRQLAAKVDQLRRDPRSVGATKMAGAEDLFRVRAGDYRIIFAYGESGVIWVVKIGDRKDLYEELRRHGLLG